MRASFLIRALYRHGFGLLITVLLLSGCVGLTLLREQLASWLRRHWQPPPAEPLSIEGLFVESGWMGDALVPGVLRVRPVSEPAPDGSPAQEWVYHPEQGRLGWVAVAYQHPEQNFGDLPGRNLSGLGFTRITFWARGQGGERVCFKSGGHTKPGAAHPASHECALGVIVLSSVWREYTLPLPARADLSNVAAVFAFTLERWPPGEGRFQLAGITLR